MIRIEFYNDLSKSKKQDYVVLVKKSDFIIHGLYEPYKTVGESVNVNDLAGVEIAWKEWMCSLESFYLSYAPDSSKITYFGYPANACESGMNFSCVGKTASVKCTGDKRIQVIDMSPNAPAKVEDIEGMSGSGMFLHTKNDVLCFAGMLICTQGDDCSNGILNGVSGSVLKELCNQNAWPVPPFTPVLIDSESDPQLLSVLADVPDSEKMIESEPLDSPDVQTNNSDLQQKKNRIKELIDNLQITTAIQLCEELYATGDDSSCAFAMIHKAYCFMMMGEFKDACILLKDACDFPLRDQGPAYLMLTDLAQNQGQGYYVKHFLSLAAQSSGEALQSSFYKRYLNMLSADSHFSDDDFNELFSLMRTQNISQREKHQIYQLLANVCFIKYQDYDNAIIFLKNCFSLRGDKSIYLGIARCYASKAFSTPKTPNLLNADFAYQYFRMYLDAADCMLRKSFYRNYGLLLCNVIGCLGDANAMYKHIDNIIEECRDEIIKEKLYVNKVQATYTVTGECSEELIRSLPEAMQIPVLLRFECQSIVSELRPLLDEKCVYEYEKMKFGVNDTIREEKLKQAESDLFGRQIILSRKILILLQSDHKMDYFFICSLSQDLLFLYLNTHQGEQYNSFLDECLSRYPSETEFSNMKAYIEEANGNPDNTEQILLRMMDEDGSPQSVKNVQNFYFRNCQYEKLIAFYQHHLEESYEAASFRKDEMIAQYIDVLLLTPYLNTFAKEQYEKYKDQIKDCSIREMLESRLGIND